MGSLSASLFEFWIFSFKVSLSGGISVCACFIAVPGLAFPPTSSNRLSTSGAGLAAAATPNVVGDIHCTISCNSIFFWHGVARIKHRGLAVGNSRKDAHAGTLPVVYLKEDLLGIKYCDVCHRAIVPSCLSSEVSLDHHDLGSFLHGHLQGLQF